MPRGFTWKLTQAKAELWVPSQRLKLGVVGPEMRVHGLIDKNRLVQTDEKCGSMLETNFMQVSEVVTTEVRQIRIRHERFYSRTLYWNIDQSLYTAAGATLQ